jgi:hypothetical protein
MGVIVACSTDLLPTTAARLRHLDAGAVLEQERHCVVREQVGGTGEATKTSMLRAARAPSGPLGVEDPGAAPLTLDPDGLA